MVMLIEARAIMSLRYAPADEIQILTGGIDLFSVLYARAEAAYPRGIWVEAFGTVKGASIIELTGDRHRESVREATLSQMSATVFHDGESPDIRSVATLTWREKRTPHSLTGFLASALATHVTLRIREVELVDERAAAKKSADSKAAASKAEAGRVAASPTAKTASGPAPATTAKMAEARSAAVSSVSPREILREAATREEVDAAVARLAEETKKKRGAVKDSFVSSWDALVADDSDAPAAPALGWGDVAQAAEAKSAPAMSWGDLANAAEETPSKSAPKPSAKAASKAAAPVAAQQSLLDESWGSWDEVAQVSAEVALRPKTAASTLKRGEVLVHPTLGNCTILSVVSESVVMVKPKHDTSRKISLKPFEIFASGKPGIYELERRDA